MAATTYAAKDFSIAGKRFLHGESLPEMTELDASHLVFCGWANYGRPADWLAKQAAERRVKELSPPVAPAAKPAVAQKR
jgi:hypothetical protein